MRDRRRCGRANTYPVESTSGGAVLRYLVIIEFAGEVELGGMDCLACVLALRVEVRYSGEDDVASLRDDVNALEVC